MTSPKWRHTWYS